MTNEFREAAKLLNALEGGKIVVVAKDAAQQQRAELCGMYLTEHRQKILAEAANLMYQDIVENLSMPYPYWMNETFSQADEPVVVDESPEEFRHSE